MAVRDRIQVIKQMAANGKKVTVSNLSGILQVTKEIIRRGLEKLEDESFLARTYGDAVLDTAILTENIHSYRRVSSSYEEKQLVARKALPFIGNKTTVAADSSNTIMELLKLLQDRSDLTLLTNSTEVTHVLAQSEIKVISASGELNENTLSLQGRTTKEIIRQYHAGIMIMSYRGLDTNGGAPSSSEAEAEIKRAVIRQATEVALLIDHSKFDHKASIQLADFSHINYIITDKSPGAEWIVFCRDNNIQLMW